MANDFIPKPEDRFHDLEGVTEKKLNFGLWYVSHRQKFVNTLLGALGFFGLITCSYAIYHFGYYFAYGIKEDELLLFDIANSGGSIHQAVQSRQATDLSATSARVLVNSSKKYDFVSWVSNSNLNWVANFDYYFSIDGQPITKTAKGYVLPGQGTFLMSLSQEVASQPVSADLAIANLSWHRINRHRIADWQAYMKSHTNFIVDNIVFKPAKESGLSEKLPLNQLDFSATNQTAYNYWEVECKIVLYSGSEIVAVNKYTITDFMSGQTRNIRSSWTGVLPRVDKIEIFPEVNILDSQAYIQFEGGTGMEK